MRGSMGATSRADGVPSQHFCHFLMWEANPELETGSVCVCFVEAPQAPRSHIRNQSLPLLFVPLLHDVMATRRRSDELRVMDICIGTFPPPRQPLFTLNVSHVVHQYHPPWPVHLQTHMWSHFLLPLVTDLHSSDWREKRKIRELCHL